MTRHAAARLCRPPAGALLRLAAHAAVHGSFSTSGATPAHPPSVLLAKNHSAKVPSPPAVPPSPPIPPVWHRHTVVASERAQRPRILCFFLPSPRPYIPSCHPSAPPRSPPVWHRHHSHRGGLRRRGGAAPLPGRQRREGGGGGQHPHHQRRRRPRPAPHAGAALLLTALGWGRRRPVGRGGGQGERAGRRRCRGRGMESGAAATLDGCWRDAAQPHPVP